MNRGEFFNAHETLETAWHKEKQPIRTLYKGLIQLSVGCFHAERQNWVGASRVLQMARGNLVPFVQAESLIDVADILHQINILEENITRIMKSPGSGVELLVSPHIRFKGNQNQEINPESE